MVVGWDKFGPLSNPGMPRYDGPRRPGRQRAGGRFEERWQSGRMRRIANPVSRIFPAPRVRIPLSPLLIWTVWPAREGRRLHVGDCSFHARPPRHPADAVVADS